MSHRTFSKARLAVLFGATFLVAWWLLNAFVTSPPNPVSSATALATAAVTLALGLRLAGTPWAEVPTALGLRRPETQAIALAGMVGALFLVVLVLCASMLGVALELRENWPVVLVGVLLFHGLAEELVWRGFVFARLRDHRGFAAAVWWSMPLIALTHSPIVVTDGWLIGALATLTAAITCWPMAYLWERGGHTMWTPALLHGLIGTWQLFERSNTPAFPVLVMGASIIVPLLVFLPGLRRTASRRISRRRDTTRVDSLSGGVAPPGKPETS